MHTVPVRKQISLVGPQPPAARNGLDWKWAEEGCEPHWALWAGSKSFVSSGQVSSSEDRGEASPWGSGCTRVLPTLGRSPTSEDTDLAHRTAPWLNAGGGGARSRVMP